MKKIIERKTILLVEDDPSVREIIKFALEKKKYYILEAASYSEAIGHIRNAIDLAIIDYILPDNNGLELVKEIRAEKPALPVIIMTAYSTETVVIQALRTGVTEYIKKPFSLSYLMRKVSEMLGGETDIKDVVDVKSRDDFIIDGIAAYMEERYMEKLTLKKLASFARMNKNKFSRAFKERFGQTFLSYLNRIRASNASEMLKNSDLHITDIATFVGYKNVDHLERIFKKVFGVSPRDYRRKIRENKDSSI